MRDPVAERVVSVYQRFILSVLRDDPWAYIVAGKFGEQAPRIRHGESFVPIPRRTFDALRQRKWIERQWRNVCNGDYRLTDAGRAALKGPQANEKADSSVETPQGVSVGTQAEEGA